MSNQVRVAVIGTGSLGKEHARIYADLAKAGLAQFTGVFDANPEAARTHAARWGCVHSLRLPRPRKPVMRSVW